MADERPQINNSNQQSLNTLLRSLNLGRGSFTVILAHSNYGDLREEMGRRLQDLFEGEIGGVWLTEESTTLYAEIQKLQEAGEPEGVMVFGLEAVEELENLLVATNNIRDEFIKNFPFPVIIWVSDEVMGQMARFAPDFYNLTPSPVFFRLSSEELLALLRQSVRRVEEYLISHPPISSPHFPTSPAKFIPNTTILGSEFSCELSSALKDLHEGHISLERELAGEVEFLLGREAYGEGDIDRAIAHYETGRNFGPSPLKVSLILFHLSLCYWERDLTTARRYGRESLDGFEAAGRPDLVAKFWVKQGEILEKLGAWDELEKLAQGVLGLQLDVPNPVSEAQAYFFLGKVAAVRGDWLEVERLLGNWGDGEIGAPGCLLLAEAQGQLGKGKAALQTLKAGRSYSQPQDDPELYLDLLAALQEAYFNSGQYLPAFELKQEQRQVAVQYGFAAFVGANRLAVGRWGDGEIGGKDKTGVALEIAASGRQLDVKRLRERMGRDDCKLTIIHGQSGVGKSSILTAGLVPALQEKAVGYRRVLAVVVQVYRDWLEKVAGELECWGAGDKDGILAQLAANEGRNLLTVLIFDQFEEFFFVHSQPQARREFFDFLAAALRIPFVKVILSLREDYVHYLWEAERLGIFQIVNHDLLSKENRYYLGNFSPQDTKKIITALTQGSRFKLEEGLIDQLVGDLAKELGEVRPIELQVVGAQLQTENITSLEGYRELGEQPQERLVEQYLEGVITDCGLENKQLAELFLLLLTDEKGTRPLKTRGELATELEALGQDLGRLDLVLEIVVKSGLVLLIPEQPEERYQLVHDYLAEFIQQQQQPQLAKLQEELAREREQRLLTQAELVKAEEAKKVLAETQKQTQAELAKAEEAKTDLTKAQKKTARVIKVGIGILAATLFSSVLVVIFASQRVAEVNQAEKKQKELLAVTTLEREGISAIEKFEFQELEALLSAMEAGQKLKKMVNNRRPISEYPTITPMLALQTILTNIRETNQLEEHYGFVVSARFSSDGQHIITASDSGIVKVWNKDGQLVHSLKGHQERVNTAEFSPDEKYIVTASWDSTAKIWDKEGHFLHTLRGHDGAISSAKFSPDGQHIITASWDGTAKLWNKEGKLLNSLNGHGDRVWNARFSPDGKYIVTASWDGTAKVWDKEGQLLHTLNGHQKGVYSARFSTDGKQVVTASWDRTAKVWDKEGQLLHTLKGHNDMVRSAEFSSDGESVLTASNDSTAKIWRDQGREIINLEGHQNVVRSARFSPDGKYIVTASEDGTAKVWNKNGKLLQSLKGHQSQVWSARFSPDGERIVTASEDGTAKVWNKNRQTLQSLEGHEDVVWSARFSPDGERIVTASRDGTVKVWNKKGQTLQSLEEHEDRVWSARFSQNGERIVTTSDDRTAKVWNKEGQLLHTLKGHQSGVYRAWFSQDGKHIVTTSWDKTVRVWDREGILILTLRGHKSVVRSARFSQDGKHIVTASDDRTAKVWNKEGQLLHTLTGHQSGVTNVEFSPDGMRILTTSKDGTARVWNKEGQFLHSLEGHKRGVVRAKFSPNGKYIVTASYDGARVWNKEGQFLYSLEGHKSGVIRAKFSPDGESIVTASYDGTAKVWDKQGREVASFEGHQGPVFSAILSQDGKYVVSASQDGTAKIWPVENLDELLNRGCNWLKAYLTSHPEQNVWDGGKLCPDIVK